MVVEVFHCQHRDQLGLSGLIVVDIDPKNGGDRTWNAIVKRYGKGVARTMTVRTGIGRHHYYFAAPPRVVSDQARMCWALASISRRMAAT